MKKVKVTSEMKATFVAYCQSRFKDYEEELSHWAICPVESYQTARQELESELMALGYQAQEYRMTKDELPSISESFLEYLRNPAFGFQPYLLVYLRNLFAFGQREVYPPMVMH